jgi:MarR family transcriptional regulator, transcriptional regulator for hemolysin
VFDIELIWYARTMRPEHTPIGLHLARTARLLSRAFDDALADAGGSLPVWLVLLNLKIQQDANQRQLAEGVGVSEATLTHHLNAMEKDGLLARRRDPANRRNHIIELTAAGEGAFTRLAAVALAFDQRLRANLEPTDLNTVGAVLDQLTQNVGADQADPPWAGLIETSTDPTRHKSTRTPPGDPRPDTP